MEVQTRLLPLLRAADADLRELDGRLASRKSELSQILELERDRTHQPLEQQSRKFLERPRDVTSAPPRSGKLRLRLV